MRMFPSSTGVPIPIGKPSLAWQCASIFSVYLVKSPIHNLNNDMRWSCRLFQPDDRRPGGMTKRIDLVLHVVPETSVLLTSGKDRFEDGAKIWTQFALLL